MTTNSDILKSGEKTVLVGEKVKVIDNGRGLAWGTDAYLLASYIKRKSTRNKIFRACELGSGCGVISFLVAAHNKADEVVAVELNDDAADRTERGIKLNSLDGKVLLVHRDVRELKFTDSDMGGRFDCVFSNPPYIAHEGPSGQDDTAADARHEANGTISDFCDAASRLLNHGGSFYIVFRPERAADLFEALRRHRLEPKKLTFVYPDVESKPSLMLCTAVFGGAPGLSVSAPLIFFNDTKNSSSRAMSALAEKIYSECSFDCMNLQ